MKNAFLIMSILLVSLVSIVPSHPARSALRQDKPTFSPTGEEATIAGTVSFVGVPPEPKEIDMSADPICETVSPDAATEDVIVTDGKLANVFVYAQTGEALDKYLFDAPSADVTLDHKGCRLVPHVLGMQTNQVLKILNDDPTTHNTHGLANKNNDWNQSQMPSAMPIERRFALPEQFMPVKDNQHPWEKAYVGIFSHPFFAVTAKDGSYKISGLPPGQYAIVAWHEKYGEQTTYISIGRREWRTLDFGFKATENRQP